MLIYLVDRTPRRAAVFTTSKILVKILPAEITAAVDAGVGVS